MYEVTSNPISRRRLLALTGLSAAALLLRRQLFAASEGIVSTMVNSAATAKITIHPLRRNITVLEGSGG